MDYNFFEIEKKWKKYWKTNNTYRVENSAQKPKFYILDMFPYPSGAGLHVGHPLGYIATDIMSRYKRMTGYNVLHPMGFDAFGLPAEQYAINTGVHPKDSTKENITRYKSQLENIGFDYDWSREVQTHDPNFYKWTQWIFIQLFTHYYDLDDNKAKSINHLISRFQEKGSGAVNACHDTYQEFSALEWNSMNGHEQADILMHYRLAYQKLGYVNWCEELGTVLANDEVKNGLSERGGFPVEKRAMKQWFLRITAYTERLLDGLDNLDWSDSLKTIQSNWIGKSEGVQMYFEVVDYDAKIDIFTTRPDTIYGATYMVLAPEHQLVDVITTEGQRAKVNKYLDYVNTRSNRERISDQKSVTGVWTGAHAINPFTNKKIPIWVGEYVLNEYGTGAIMAVPSDDERDFAFASKFNLPIIKVVDKSSFPNANKSDKVGKLVNSNDLNGLDIKDAIPKIIQQIENLNLGRRKTNHKITDANFSRQRYWGEPFPIQFINDIAYTLDDSKLPLTLPDLTNYKPAPGGKSPLERNNKWLSQFQDGILESDTMPGYAGSSWYYLRYMDPQNNESLIGEEASNYWKNVDIYIGGTEHAVGHLLYSRFWHKFLFDLNKVPTKEPFQKLVNQGMILGVIENLCMLKEKRNGKTVFVSADIIDTENNDYTMLPVHIDFVSDYGSNNSYLDNKGVEQFINWKPNFKQSIFRHSKGDYIIGESNEEIKILTHSEVGKMSKRYFNVVNPDDVVAKYGADCFRMYEMFLGPLEQSKPWDTNGIDGVSKFLRKFWSLYIADNTWIVNNDKPTADELKILHSTIKKVNQDINNFSLNTAVSAFMICVNELRSLQCHKKEILEPLLRLIAPFAPFISEELNSRFGYDKSIHKADYPVYNEAFLIDKNITYPLCINGKKKTTLEIESNLSKSEIETFVLNHPNTIKLLRNNRVKKCIIVPNRMINLVI